MNNFQIKLKKHEQWLVAFLGVNVESSFFLVNDVIFRELWSSKTNYRASWFAIFNSRELCAWPPLRPLKTLLVGSSKKFSIRQKERID